MNKTHRWPHLAAVALVALSLSATALAGNPPPTDGGSQGKGVSTIKYTAVYTDPFYGPVSCTGVHQTGKNFGEYGQDSFTCTSTAGGPLWHVSPGQSLSLDTARGWYSDYYYFAASPATVLWATSLTGTVSLDGESYTAVASY